MWHFIPETDRFHASLAINSDPEGYDDSDICFRDESKPTDVQGVIMADALTVHEATGLTPSQLQARVAELEAALQMARAVHESNTGAGRDSWVEVRRVLGVK